MHQKVLVCTFIILSDFDGLKASSILFLLVVEVDFVCFPSVVNYVIVLPVFSSEHLAGFLIPL